MENQVEEIAALTEKSKGFDASLLDKDPATLSPEEVKSISDNAKTQFALKKHWQVKAIDPTTGKPYVDLLAEAQTKLNQGSGTGQAAKPDEKFNTLEKDVAQIKQSEEKRQFGYDHSLSPEETDKVFAFATGVGKKPAEVLDDPFVKSGVAAIRTSKRNASATPGISSRLPVVEGKTFEKMNEDERRANFGKMTGAARS